MSDRLSQLQGFLEKTPEDAFLNHALALEWVARGRDAEARQLWEDLLHRQPTYVGSYYHLAKLLERLEATAEALAVYERGMQEAEAAGDKHAHSELRSAYEELAF